MLARHQASRRDHGRPLSCVLARPHSALSSYLRFTAVKIRGNHHHYSDFNSFPTLVLSALLSLSLLRWMALSFHCSSPFSQHGGPGGLQTSSTHCAPHFLAQWSPSFLSAGIPLPIVLSCGFVLLRTVRAGLSSVLDRRLLIPADNCRQIRLQSHSICIFTRIICVSFSGSVKVNFPSLPAS